jgi:hypothetical protein
VKSAELWTVLEYTGAEALALACAIRSDELPGSPPLPILEPQNGRQRQALAALHPLAAAR